MIQKKEIKYLASLKQKKFRLINKEIVIEGSKLILDAIKHKQNIKKIIYCAKDECFDKIRKQAKQNNIELKLCTSKDAERISDTKNSQQIFALLSFNPLQKTSKNILLEGSNIIVMDGIADPGNMGTILRTCSWFGYYDIMLSDKCVEFYNPKTIRSGMGSHFHMNSIYKDNIKNIMKYLSENNYEIIVANLNGTKLNNYKIKNKKWALVLGNESKGLSSESLNASNVSLTIDGNKTMESLNVAEAGSIIMHDLYHKSTTS